MRVFTFLNSEQERTHAQSNKRTPRFKPRMRIVYKLIHRFKIAPAKKAVSNNIPTD